jgi:hypothetical protein
VAYNGLLGINLPIACKVCLDTQPCDHFLRVKSHGFVPGHDRLPCSLNGFRTIPYSDRDNIEFPWPTRLLQYIILHKTWNSSVKFLSSLYFIKEFRARGAWNDKFIYAIDLSSFFQRVMRTHYVHL